MAPITPTVSKPLGTLYTLGYAKLGGSEDLVRLLEEADVHLDALYDVRIKPWAGNPNWRPGATERTVKAAGVRSFMHVPGLGNPNYKSDTLPMAIADPAAIEWILTPLRMGYATAILCVCANWLECHRRLVVDLAVAAEPELNVVHLGQPHGSQATLSLG